MITPAFSRVTAPCQVEGRVSQPGRGFTCGSLTGASTRLLAMIRIRIVVPETIEAVAPE
jgi:hypothetical protein